MSRIVRRVPLDFAWPIRKTWSGYINPHGDACTMCTRCDGTGLGPQAKHLHDQWYGNAPYSPREPFTADHAGILLRARGQVEHAPDFYGTGEEAIRREAARLAKLFNESWSHHLSDKDVAALIAEDRLWDFTRVPRNKEQAKSKNRFPNGWLKQSNGYVPTAREVNEWSIFGIGHDGLNAFVCIEAKCKRLLFVYRCDVCAGHGVLWSSSEAKTRAEAWKRTDPPSGEGFQLWESVSEGSAISPVFPTANALIDWLTVYGDSRRGDEPWTREEAEALVRAGDAVSCVEIGGEVHGQRGVALALEKLR